MNVERVLQILVAVISVLSAVLLGLEGPESVLPAFVLFAAVTSIIFTDVLGWFRLSKLVVNAIALGAMLYALYGFLQADHTAKLQSVANLLVYWQVVMLYQQKNPGAYALLMMLSLLEVVVGAALNTGFLFGILLMVYMALALVTLGVFFIYQTRERYLEAAGELPAGKRELTPQDPAWQQLLGEAPEAQRDVSSLGVLHTLPRLVFAKQILALVLTTFFFATIFFYTAPRERNSIWRKASSPRQARVGFAREISLDEMGQILQSDDLVMRVDLYDENGAPYLVYGEPYFRGRALDTYLSGQGGNGRWIHTVKEGDRPHALRDHPRHSPVVIQDIRLEPTARRLLFAVHPVYRTAETPEGIRFDPKNQELSRRNSDPSTPFRYQTATTGFNHGMQLHLLPTDKLDVPRKLVPAVVDDSNFPVVTQLAVRILEEAGVADGNVMLRARTLTNHFRSSGDYTYTLDFSNVPKNSTMDPIEHFLANHRMGHCEYFASALALMLRSQGIPARMIVGYKGGEYNSVGRFYLVRERDAHAWVEAYLEPEEVPVDLVKIGLAKRGAWMRLDPTPASATVIPERKTFDTVLEAVDYAHVLWSDYVVGLDPERQQAALVTPVATLLDVTDWTAYFGGFSRLTAAASGIKQWLGGHWFSWRAGVAAMFACAFLWGLRQLATMLVRRLRPWWHRRRQAAIRRRKSIRVAFYERLEQLLARLDIYRSASQTQREFVAAATRLMDGRLQQEAAPLMDTVIEAFYRVRFGGSALTDIEVHNVDASLGRLERIVDGYHQHGLRQRNG